MSFNAAGLVEVVFYMSSYLIRYVIALGSQLVDMPIFHVYMFMFTVNTTESYTTCILLHVAYNILCISALS